MSKIALFCCGGLGVNIGARFIRHLADPVEGFAQVDPRFIDTSDANLSDMIPTERVWIAETTKGSGKIRALNYDVIVSKTKDILAKFPPTEINVFVHSSHGGSGSVIGPVLAGELLSRGHKVIILTVGGTSSRKETENTINTLRSYESLSKKYNVPVLMSYSENTREMPSAKVDAHLNSIIVLLAAIFSGKNKALDDTDLKNFLNFTKVTTFDPRLTQLDFFCQEVDLPENQALVAAVTLAEEGTDTDINVPVEYQAVGYVTPNVKEGLKTEMPVHACAIAGFHNIVMSRLDDRMATYIGAREAVKQKAIIANNDDATDEGIIL